MDSAEVKSSDCSFRRPGLSSQHPLSWQFTTILNPHSRTSNACSGSSGTCIHRVCLHTCRQNIHKGKDLKSKTQPKPTDLA